MDSNTQVIAPDAVNASALAADAVAEIQLGLATAGDVATLASAIGVVQADTDNIQTRLPAALIGGRMDSNVQAAGADVIDASVLAQNAAQEIADEFLARNLAGGGSGDSRNVRNALRSARNRVEITALGALTVYEEDDVTPAWIGTATRVAGVNPIVEINPA
jgi:nicotinamide riboside kinase